MFFSVSGAQLKFFRAKTRPENAVWMLGTEVGALFRFLKSSKQSMITSGVRNSQGSICQLQKGSRRPWRKGCLLQYAQRLFRVRPKSWTKYWPDSAAPGLHISLGSAVNCSCRMKSEVGIEPLSKSHEPVLCQGFYYLKNYHKKPGGDEHEEGSYSMSDNGLCVNGCLVGFCRMARQRCY